MDRVEKVSDPNSSPTLYSQRFEIIVTQGRLSRIVVLYLLCRDSFVSKAPSSGIVWFVATGAIFLGLWLKAGAVLSLLSISVWALAAVAFVTTWLVIAHCSGYLFHVAVEARSRGVSFWEIRAQPFYPQIRESFARKMSIN